MGATGDIEDLRPCVPMYGPCQIRGLTIGQVKYWCTCGLSKKQPWCDGSHKGTPFEPLKWTVPGTKKDGKAQTLYSICACKYTQDPPYCDATHIHLPLQVLDRQDKCTKDHSPQIVGKLCASCGFRPPSEAPP